MKPFAHLHLHSAFSLLDGAVRIPELVQQVREMDMPAVALTDHGVLYGAIKFYRECRQAGIHPVIGCEVNLTSGGRRSRSRQADRHLHHLVLLAESNKGYHNLCQMVSQSFRGGFDGKPRVDDELLQQYSEGLICLSGCLNGDIPSLLKRGQTEAAKSRAAFYRQLFGSQHFYLEIQNHGLDEEKRVNEQLARLSDSLDIPLVATHDVHYLSPSDAEAHDVLLAVQTGKRLDDENRLRFPSQQFHLTSPDEMYERFSGFEDAVARTVEIAERCQVDFDFETQRIPTYDLAPEVSPADYLEDLCREGINQRYSDPDPGVLQRLEHELAMIQKMGYAGYFLIVWDLIRYARNEGIPVGPGRGSAAGSLVAYLLGITQIDPIAYGLPFERFLNPERVTMPDVDIDFGYERRDEVIDYVRRKYGQSSVAQIITFGTMAPRAVVRDVGRVLGFEQRKIDELASQIPNQPRMTLDRALEGQDDLSRRYRRDGSVARLIDIARRLEGLPRHASVHAAGVVISDDPLAKQVPLQTMDEHAQVTQFDMDDLEKLGLLKLDFLGLRTLTVIEKTVHRIDAAGGPKLDPDRLPLDDDKTFQLIQSGATAGIFQLESTGMRRMLQELKPDSLRDVMAAVALFRPGPMEYIQTFIELKHGRRPATYLHEDLKPVLAETYGIMIYQEQIMQVAATMAGFSLGEADILRRAMGKKKPALLRDMKARFIQGCRSQGYDQALAEQLYEQIARFADYGFSKCHSAPYALLAYQTAYLKAHYPEAFMSAQLSTVMDRSERIAEYVIECRRLGIEVKPPHINRSEREFMVKEGAILTGLGAVRHLGRQAIDQLVVERRRAGDFQSLRDFCERMDTGVISKKAVESLIKAGAFDGLGRSRGSMLGSLDRMWRAVRSGPRLGGQTTLFSGAAEQDFGMGRPVGTTGDDEALSGRMRRRHEREALGLYLSGERSPASRTFLKQQTTHRLDDLLDLDRPETEWVSTGGWVVEVKQVSTKQGKPMAFVQLQQEAGRLELIFFPETYSAYRRFLEQDALLAVNGRLQRRNDRPQVVVKNAIVPLIQDAVVLRCDRAVSSRSLIDQLASVVEPFYGLHPLVITVGTGDVGVCLDPRYWIQSHQQAIASLHRVDGVIDVRVSRVRY